MKIRWPVFLVGAAIFALSACGDGGPNLIRHDTDLLVHFKRVTLAADARDRLEIELEVRSGSDFSNIAPEGTPVTLETSAGVFEHNGPRMEARTLGGHIVATLILPDASRFTLTARAGDVESSLVIDVASDGSIQVDPS